MSSFLVDSLSTGIPMGSAVCIGSFGNSLDKTLGIYSWSLPLHGFEAHVRNFLEFLSGKGDCAMFMVGYSF